MNEAKHCLQDATQEPGSPSRRKIFKIAAAGVAAGLGFGARAARADQTANEVRVVVGDRLVEEDAEGEPVPLKVADLKVGKPLLAFPYDPSTKQARTDSRLNKIMLIRLSEDEMDDETKAVAAGGVLAFSAICTHQGCDVKTYMKSDKVLACFCHASKFDPLKGAKVVGGPAPRALPVLPLRLEGDEIVVAADYSAPPGAALQ